MAALIPGRATAALRRAWEINKPLTILGVSMVLLLLLTSAGMVVDSRLVTGAPVWTKPSKFALSVSIYAFTFLWMLSLVRGHRRLVRLVATVTTVAFAVEVGIIVVQAARGTTSHFNVSTPAAASLWAIMAVTIVTLWLMTFIAAVLLLRQSLDNPVLAWGIRLGLLLALVGMGVGFLMTGPTPNQLAAIQAGHPTGIIGAHTVGLDDGGPGLPLLNWSTKGGDLRVPHFVGLHALQIMPLVAWLVGTQLSRLGRRRAVRMVWLLGLTYLGLIGLLTWQAERGQSVVAPDGLTLAALAVIVAATSVVGLLLLLWRQERPTRMPARAMRMIGGRS
jgi:hypothetical protein